MNSIIKVLLCVFFCTSSAFLVAQKQEWEIIAADINSANYYGITVASGMVGLVSSPEPMKIMDIVLDAVYDNYAKW
ncbi:MAG: hypothetical protein AAF731_15610 [Bacteroidota bacterium]